MRLESGRESACTHKGVEKSRGMDPCEQPRGASLTSAERQASEHVWKERVLEDIEVNKNELKRTMGLSKADHTRPHCCLFLIR